MADVKPDPVITKMTSIERMLNAFAPVRPREGITSLMLLLNIFLILTAYYLVKPVREGWLAVSVIQGFSSTDVKAISAFGQTILLLAILPFYARIAARWSRRELVTRSGVFFGALLLSFWLLQPDFLFARVPYAGVAFYLAVGIFNVTLVAQFWAFAADIYGEERGKRLFPLVAIGAAGGAMFGSLLGERLIRLEWLGTYELILLALLPLGLAVVVARIVDGRGTYGQPSEWTTQRWEQPAAPDAGGPFRPIFSQRYLTAAAFLILIFNWVLTSGDIILFGLVQQAIEADFTGDGDITAFIETQTTIFYGDIYFWINLFGLLLQAFVVSRLMRAGGFGLLILTTPVIAVTAYASMLLAPVLAVVKFMKIAEVSSNHSINNTARQMLWLPATKSVLYQTKTAVDTLFVRLGDGLAALTLLLGTRFLNVDLQVFLIINLLLALVWIALARFVLQEYRRLSDTGDLAHANPVATSVN